MGRRVLVLAIALTLGASSPAFAAQVPWRAPDVLYTFGNLQTTISSHGVVDTTTGRTTIYTTTTQTGGLQASGVIYDVTRTQQVLVSGTPGNPFDPPVYETQVIGTHDATWEHRYVLDMGFPAFRDSPISAALTASVGSVFFFFNTSTTQWGSETFEGVHTVGVGTLNIWFQFDLAGVLLGLVLDPSANPDPGGGPQPNVFYPAIPPGSGSAFDGVPRYALPFNPTATLVPEPGIAVLNTNAATDSGFDIFPQIATDGAGNWVSIWQSSENLGGSIGTDFDILTAQSSDEGDTWSAPAVLNSTASSDSSQDDFPGLASDGAGNWIAIWRSDNSLGGTIGTDWDVLFARSTDNGTTWSPAAALNSYAEIDTGFEDRPVIASDGDAFLAAWGSNDGSLGPDYDIRVSRSTDGGVTWSASTPLNSGAHMDSANDEHPFLAPDGSGNWIAVWESDSSALGGDGDILVARSVDGGISWSAPVPLNTNAATDAGKDAWPRVETDGLGTWVSAWESDENLAGSIGIDRDIFFARSTNGGATWTAPAALNSNAPIDAGDDANPEISNDGAGIWIAVWDSGDSIGGIGTDYDVLTARSTDAGISWTNSAPLNTNASSDIGGDYNPRIATKPAGPSVVVWHSEENLNGTAGTDWDVFFSITSPPDLDSDLDGIFNADDNCPIDANPSQEDADLDGIGDACDPFPNDPCNSIGALPRSTATLAASQDNSCENWAGHTQPGSNLQSAVLRKTDLSAANLNGTLLLNANLSGASFANASMVSCQIRFANLDSAIMTNADLSFTSLLGSNLASADMTSADLSFAVMTGATYNESTIFPSGEIYETPPWGLDGGISPWEAGMVPVPEPSIGWMLLLGAGALAGVSILKGGG